MVCPKEDFGFCVDFQINRLGQVLKEQFDVRSGGCGFFGSGIDIGAEDSSLPCFAGAFLGPVEFAVLGVDGDSNTLTQVSINGIKRRGD